MVASLHGTAVPTIDFAIISGLTEELSVLNTLFREFRIPAFREMSSNADVWYRTRITANKGRSYEVVASFQDDMGPLQAQALTQQVIEQWNPAYIILIGIAGTFSSDATYGDILVSQQVFYYDPGKATKGSIRYRPEGYPCSIVLIRQLNALALDVATMKRIRAAAKASAAEKALLVKPPANPKAAKKFDAKGAKKALRGHSPNVVFGTLASGSLVIDDRRKQKTLLELHGKILGTEMEGAGMMFATFREEIPPAAIVIKGVSDAADGNKSKADAKRYWRDLGKENSARLALEMIRRGRIKPLNADQFTLDPTLDSAAEAAKVLTSKSIGTAPLAFRRLVVPRGPLTELRIEVTPFRMGARLRILEAMIRTLDLTNQPKEYAVEAGNNSWEIRGPFTASPVELYALVDGEPDRIAFAVSNSYELVEATWIPEKR